MEFGDIFRDASHTVADCAHSRFRVAIGRRSIACAADSFIEDESIAGPKKNDEITSREDASELAPRWEPGARKGIHPIGWESTRFVLHCASSFVMMQRHASDVGTNRAETAHAAFRVHSAIHQHNRAMDSGPANHVLGLRDLILGFD